MRVFGGIELTHTHTRELVENNERVTPPDLRSMLADSGVFHVPLVFAWALWAKK